MQTNKSRAFLGLFLITIITLPWTATSFCPAEPDIKLHKQCIYPVVRLREMDKKGSGTGFIIASQKLGPGFYRNVVLTNAHVAKRQNITADVPIYDDISRFYKFDKHACAAFAIDEADDLGIVVFNSAKQMPVVTLDPDTKLFIGAEVYRIGCGAGEEPRLDKGEVTSINYDGGNIRTNVYTVLGDSGSPLYHDYKVVGIAYAIKMSLSGGIFIDQMHKVSAYIPIQKFVEWEKKNPELKALLEWKPPKPTLAPPQILLDELRLPMPDPVLPELEIIPTP